MKVIVYFQVSPQFHRPLSAPKRRRQALQRGKLPGKENSTTLPPARRKFTSLAFVGVEISPVNSQPESFNESGDRLDAGRGVPAETCPRVTRSRTTRKSGVDNCTRRKTCAPTQLHPTDSTQCGSFHLATSIRRSDTCDSPLYETQHKPRTRSTRQSSRRLFSTETPPRVSSEQQSEHATSLLQTPVTDDGIAQSPDHGTSLLRPLDTYNGASEDPNCDNSVTTPILNNNNRCSRGLRRNRCTTRAWWLFTETPHKDMSAREQPVVLAADTPVGDYALPVRLRNLKYSRT